MKTERELFEERFGTPEHWIEFCDIRDKYICKHNAIDHHLIMRNAKWESWQARVPDGYKLVPCEPTKEMLIAADNCVIDGKVTSHNIYKAMIGAAP